MSSHTASRRAAGVLLTPLSIVLVQVVSSGSYLVLRNVARTTAFDDVVRIGLAGLAPMVVLFLLATDGRPVRRPLPTFPWRYAAALVVALLVGETILSRADVGFFRPAGIVGIIAYVVVGPLTEELLFRGALYDLVLDWSTGFRAHVLAISVTSLAFALSHFGGYGYRVTDLALTHVGLMVPVGLFLAWLRARSGSIWPSTIVHAAMNALWLLL
jgi:membrane protease YdiL (CAAX protease family)